MTILNLKIRNMSYFLDKSKFLDCPKSNTFKIMKTKITFLLIFISIVINAQNTSLSFDGIDDRVQIPHQAELIQNQFTFEAWIKLNQLGMYHPVVTKYNTSIGELSYALGILSSGVVEIAVYESFSNFSLYQSNSVITANTWHHIATSYDISTNTFKIFIDGIEVTGTASGSNSINSIMSTTIPVSIGSITTIEGNVNYFSGFIDEFRFWNVIKSEVEIQANMNTELTGLETGLVSYYKMDDDSTGCDVYDCNSNENHGARTGINGTNNLPQYVNDAPTIANIDCGASISNCTLSTDTDELNEIKFYPNPTTGLLNIELKDLDSINTISIFNINGTKVFENVYKNDNKILIKLDYPSGIYIVKLKSNKDHLKYFKIIKI